MHANLRAMSCKPNANAHPHTPTLREEVTSSGVHKPSGKTRVGDKLRETSEVGDIRDVNERYATAQRQIVQTISASHQQRACLIRNQCSFRRRMM
jgi:hypothetical protein